MQVCWQVKCFHHQVCDSVSVPALLNSLESQIGAYYEKHGKHYHDIMKRSKILTDCTQASKEADCNHIDYVVPQILLQENASSVELELMPPIIIMKGGQCFV
jgi:hypothetical protein